jgi:hypothetical protein
MGSVPEISPWDKYNEALLAHVHPPDWENPEPAPRYNLVVIGAGAAGLVSVGGRPGFHRRDAWATGPGPLSQSP